LGEGNAVLLTSKKANRMERKSKGGENRGRQSTEDNIQKKKGKLTKIRGGGGGAFL